MSWFPDRFGEGSRGLERAPVFVLMKSEVRKGTFGTLGGGGCYTQLGREWGSNLLCDVCLCFHSISRTNRLNWGLGLCHLFLGGWSSAEVIELFLLGKLCDRMISK